MANLNDLNLIEEDAPEVDVTESLPSQFGAYLPPLQPGTYTFRLPAKDVLAEAFEPVDVNVGGTVQRVIAVDLKGAAKLDALGHGGFETRITTKPVPRGKEKINVSDTTYLLQALGHQGAVKGHKGQAEAIASHGGETFNADVDWTGFCSKDKDIYVQTDEGAKKQEGIKGCGTNFATKGYTRKDGGVVYEIPKENGKYMERFTCGCGATIRVFSRLQNFQPSKVK